MKITLLALITASLVQAQPMTADALQNIEDLAAAELKASFARRDAKDAESKANHQSYLYGQASQLYPRQAISEEEFRRAEWQDARARQQQAIADHKVRETDTDNQVHQFRVSLDQGKKLDINDLVKLYVQLWDERVAIAHGDVEVADLDLSFRRYQRTKVQGLVGQNAASQNELAAAIELEQLADHEKARAAEVEKGAIEARARIAGNLTRVKG